MYQLVDILNSRILSSSRTAEAAIRADDRHQRAVRRANGPDSYVPTVIMKGSRETLQAALDRMSMTGTDEV